MQVICLLQVRELYFGITNGIKMRIKTGVSIDKDLFDKAEKIAKELGISRSRLFSMGLQEMILQQENRRLFERLNSALEKIYPDPEEEKHIRQMKEYHRKQFPGD